MAYNSDGYIMIDFTEVDFRRTNQTIDGLYKRCVDVIGTNKFILVINANGRTPLPATCSFTNNQYVIDTCIYMFAISSNDNLFIRRNDVPASDIIDDNSISVDKTWSSNKIDTELDGKQDTLTAGTNITIDENNVISSTGGAVIDDTVIVNNKVWSSLNTVEMLAPIDTIINNPVEFKTSLALPLIACKVHVSATQEGSGVPSPSNVRPIHGFSEVNVTANEVLHTIQLGQELYGAEVDVVNGVAHVDRYYKAITQDTSLTVNQAYIKSDACCCAIADTTIYPLAGPSVQPDLLCDKLKQVKIYGLWNTVGYPNCWCIQTYNIFLNIANDVIGVIDYTQETTTTVRNKIKAWLENNPVHLIIPIEPFDIQLTPTQIETLIGNNTISSDIEPLTVSYKALPIDLL